MTKLLAHKLEQLGVRVTAKFKAAIERAAHDEDQTASDYVRRLLRARLIRDGYLDRPARPKSKRRG